MLLFNKKFTPPLPRNPNLPALGPKTGPQTYKGDGKVSFWLFSWGRGTLDKGKYPHPGKTLYWCSVAKRRKKCPLEEMEGERRRASILKCQALYWVPLCTSIHSSLTWAQGVSTASSHELSTAEATEAQRGARTCAQVSMAPNPSSQPPRVACRLVAAYCVGAAVIPGPCVSLTSQEKRGDQVGKRSLAFSAGEYVLPSCSALSLPLIGTTCSIAREMFTELTRQTVN